MQRRPSFQLPDFVWYPNAVTHLSTKSFSTPSKAESVDCV
jgi:hypothetical protein